jgi:hypothetical protein
VRQNPQTMRISTQKSLVEKINQAFKKNPERASDVITKMGVWSYVPITKIVYPYYVKHKNKITTK